MLALLLWLVSLDPQDAAHLVTPDQAERDRLVAIAWRESRIRSVGIHKVDHAPRGYRGDGLRAARRVGSRAWVRAVQRGLLRPDRCSWHALGEPSRWSTRGSWGQVAAFAVPYLPGCWPPWALDVPAVGAWVALQRLRVKRPTRALLKWAQDGV